ncbi:MAG: GntR family transcriptional regulator [Sulfurimicrobium sp.]|nr:GntR family transcriptional regulator [Sulfurimicrobium sp.]MDP1704882.1 GntR family transcriptional regulator [Sulfurimicrobium sp.]MDP1898470.1 GntR family transcriptional regulator [Sulfurimicrobium sp.]MDP2199953.1 GntR family transcriptional regulator [Sulfurimicrobium sp.]MDP3688246.1 GntR family transcriptional regulator [Sulfurimicrobium sp.]
MKKDPASANFLPLYEQIKRLITRGLAEGEWPPGEAIPSEMELARRYQVSQGTVRKAIDELVKENYLVRRQGKGTFVATHADDGTAYRFLHLFPLEGEREYPHSRFIGFGRGKADAPLAKRLSVRPGSGVVILRRVLEFSGKPVVYDDIRLPVALLKGISSAMIEDHVNAHKGTLYSLYETRYAIRIVSAQERICAALADEISAPLLNVAIGSPLLCIERVAFSYNLQPVEWRKSYINTENYYYFDELN